MKQNSWKIILFLIIAIPLRAQQVAYGNNPMAGKFSDVNGMKMYYEVYGKGKPVLMIHGNGGSIEAFSRNIPVFAKNYRVIAADSRAQGKSVDLQERLSFEMMADDYAKLLTNLNIDSCYVIGFSDGGIIALLLAIRHPEKVKKLASTGANLWPDSTALTPAVWKNFEKEFRSRKTRNYSTPEERNQHKLFLLDYFQPHIAVKSLQNIKSPSLIICGDHDVIRTDHTELISKNIPNATLWVVPNSGHATLIDHADEFNLRVADFFKSR